VFRQVSERRDTTSSRLCGVSVDTAAGGAEDGNQDTEIRVTWAELFFDLVFVFAITGVSGLLRGEQSWGGVLRALIVFVPVYWCWVGASIHANTHDIENGLDRVGVFAVGLGGLFMALALPGAYEQRAALFAASYYAARLILVGLVWRGRRMPLVTYLVPVLVSGPLLLAGAFLPPVVREALWAMAGLIDLATPTVVRRRLLGVRFSPAHLTERFGGFLIIALGESIVAIGAPAAAARHLDGAVVATVAAAFVLACALWWVYFVYAASAIRFALRTASVPGDIIRQVLTFGHLSFIGSVIAVSVGVADAVAEPGHRLGGPAIGLLFGGCALYLATFGYTRWRMFRKVSTTRLGAAAVVLVLLPIAPWLPALALLSVLAVIVVALNVLEGLRVRRASAN
jgi:low temperature requirement protein LtrA